MDIRIPHIAVALVESAQSIAARCDRLVARQRRSYSARRAEQIEVLRAQYRTVNGLAIEHGAL